MTEQIKRFTVIENSITDLAISDDRTSFGFLQGLLTAEKITIHDQLSTAFLAAKNGALEVLALLVGHGLSLDARGSYSCPAEVDPVQRAPSHGSRDILEMAVIGGRQGVVEFLLQMETQYNKQVFDKAVALSEAASRGHEGIVSVILSNAGDSVSGLNLGDALYRAAYRGHTDVVQLLGSFAEIIGTSDMNDACFCARAQKHKFTLQTLSEMGAMPVQSLKRAIGSATQINSLGRPETLVPIPA